MFPISKPGWLLALALLASVHAGANTASPPPLSKPKASPEMPLGAEYLGTFAGEATVSAGGNASYNLPIEIPPGTRGMAPNISINYNSNMRNGLLGLGWFMQGVSSRITRCAQTLSQDGKIRAISYKGEDRFCLDGNRLLAVNGSYGAHGTEYRTEIDGFSRIISHGSAGAGPAYFTVETKSGLTQYYGSSKDSRIEAHTLKDVRLWALNRSEDRQGNYYSVEYFENPSSRQYYPTRVSYTGNDTAGLAPNAEIVFTYENRSDWDVVQYSGGYEYRLHPARLASIQTFVDENLVTDYRLGYEETGADRRSRLSRIERCDASDNCQAPINLQWWSSKPRFSPYDLSLAATYGETPAHTMPRWHDFNGDGRPDYIRSVHPNAWSANKLEIALSGPEGYDTQVWTMGFSGYPSSFVWADINGDGRTDILSKRVSGLTTNYDVALSTNNGFESQVWSGHTRNAWSKSTAYYLRDMNGDRMLDLVVRESSTDSNSKFYDCQGNYTTRYRNYHYYYVHLNTGADFGGPEFWLNRAENAELVGDFNGDGLTDVIENSRYLRINTGKGFGPRKDWGSYGDYNCYSGAYSATYADQNGDGLMDRYAGGKLQINTGRSFKTVGVPALSPVADFDSNRFGDSYVRSHNAYSGDTQLYFSLAVDQFGLRKQQVYSQSLYGFNRFQQATDVNGDGLTDYTAARTYVSDPGNGHGHYSATWTERGTVRVWENKGDHSHLLKSITSGAGKQVAFTYSTLTDDSLYKKHHDSQLPILDVQDSSVTVVAKISRSNGLGGLTDISYRYEGMKRDLGGRGNLGFAKISAHDLDKNTKTETFYSQSFPHTMQPTRVILRRYSDELALVDTVISYSTHGSIGSTPVFPYLKSSRKTVFDPIDGRMLSTKTITNDCDAYGNITQSSNLTEDFENSITHQTRTISTFNPQEANWQIAQLASRVQQYSLNGSSDSTKDRRTEYRYHSGSGLVQTVSSERGAGTGIELEKTLEYDVFGNPVSNTISGPGLVPRTTSLVYDDRAQFILSARNPMGHETGTTWDKRFGRKQSETDPNGQRSTWTYDGFGQALSTTNPDGTSSQTRLYIDESGGNAPAATYSETTSTYAPPSRTFFDVLGRTVRERTQGFQGNYVNRDTSYDAAGRVYRKSEPYFEGDSVSWNISTYDSAGRVIALDAADPAASVTTHYNGFTATTSDAQNRMASRTLNAIQQVISVVDAGGTEMTFTYDAAGNRTKVVNAVGTARQNTVLYSYDRLGRLLTQTDPDHGTYFYTYDALGQKLSEISPGMAAKGQELHMQYDLLGRLIQRQEPEGITVWTYDSTKGGNLGIGQLHSENSSGFSRSYSYGSGNYGRLTGTLTTIDDSTYTTSRTYDDRGRVASEKHPASPGTSGFTVQYSYNNLGYLERVHAPDSPDVYYQLIDTDAAGRSTEEWLGDGSWTSQSYEGQSARIVSQHTVNGAQSIQHFAYAYDDAGNMNKRNDMLANLSETFTFDKLDRLTSAQVSGNATITYDFDEIGNITNKSDTGSPFLYTIPAVHAVTSIQAGPTLRNLNYDSNGNYTNGDDEPSILWTSYNKPYRINKGKYTYKFEYGPDRKRYKKIHNRITTHYIGDSFEQTYRSTNNEYRHVIRANGRAIMLRKESAGKARNEYIHRDHLGSITATTAESDGHVIERYSYDAWGGRRSPTDWVFPVSTSYAQRGYTGHEHLEDVGLIHMNGRVYSPSRGRMLSPDPITQAPENGQNYNRYSYALNNPLKFTDPSGYQISELNGSMNAASSFGIGGPGITGLRLLARSTSQYSVVEFRERIPGRSYRNLAGFSNRNGAIDELPDPNRLEPGDQLSLGGSPVARDRTAGNLLDGFEDVCTQETCILYSTELEASGPILGQRTQWEGVRQWEVEVPIGELIGTALGVNDLLRARFPSAGINFPSIIFRSGTEFGHQEILQELYEQAYVSIVVSGRETRRPISGRNRPTNITVWSPAPGGPISRRVNYQWCYGVGVP